MTPTRNIKLVEGGNISGLCLVVNYKKERHDVLYQLSNQ